MVRREVNGMKRNLAEEVSNLDLLMKSGLRTFLKWLMSSLNKPYSYKELAKAADSRGDVPTEKVTLALELGEAEGIVEKRTWEGIDLYIRKKG